MSVNVRLSGLITDIFPSEINGSYEKRVFWVLEQGERYPEHWELHVKQGECNTLDNFKPGDLVDCQVNVKGFRYESKKIQGKVGVINGLQCWKITKQGENTGTGAVSNPKQQHQSLPASSYNQGAGAPGGGSVKQPDDDLPF